MIDPGTAGHRRREFLGCSISCKVAILSARTDCERGSNKPVEDRDGDEFINDSWWASITDGLSISFLLEATVEESSLDGNGN